MGQDTKLWRWSQHGILKTEERGKKRERKGWFPGRDGGAQRMISITEIGSSKEHHDAENYTRAQIKHEGWQEGGRQSERRPEFNYNVNSCCIVITGH